MVQYLVRLNNAGDSVMKKILVTTLLGGVLFLVPMVFVAIILGKAFQLTRAVAQPIQKLLPADSVLGVGVIDLLAILLILLICMLAGIIARSGPARAFYHKMDGLLMEIIPGYAWTKTIVGSLAGGESVDQNFRPVLVTLDDQMQVAFELERLPNNLVVVFFPGAPDVRSGAVAFVTADRVAALDTSFLTVNKTMRHMGRGAAQLLPSHYTPPASLG
jgi:uncharacterized membrane protein